MKEKNLIWADVEMVLSVELKNKEIPSKTLLEYKRKIKESKSDLLNNFQKRNLQKVKIIIWKL